MAKIILAREEDYGEKDGGRIALLVNSLTGGICGGVPVGAILSGLMPGVLNNSSEPVIYGFFLGPVFFGMVIVYLLIKDEHCPKNYAKCKTCHKKMRPLTETDVLFKLPAMGEEAYGDALHYLAANIKKISGMRELEEHQRCCYVCVYQCDKCFRRIIRIWDFLPNQGQCIDYGTYYFDYMEFVRAAGQNDLCIERVTGI